MTNITLQKTGSMIAYGVNLPYVPHVATVSSFPTATPPPPWTEGNQWDNIPHQTPPPPNDAYGFTKIVDRSSQVIPLNKGYSFASTIGVNYGAYFELHGVAGGSTCVPGVALFNLSSNKDAWTYVKPQNFDGAFTVSWQSTFFVTLATMTIGYLPAQSGFNNSRLWYEFSGAAPYYAPGASVEQADTGCDIVHSGSGPYVLDAQSATKAQPQGRPRNISATSEHQALR